MSASARRSVLKVQLKITPEFHWHDRAHGGSLRWHLWVEDSDSENIYHTEVRLVLGLKPIKVLSYLASCVLRLVLRDLWQLPGCACGSQRASQARTHERRLGWPRCGR